MEHRRAPVAQELSIIYNTTSKNALLWWYEDATAAISLYLSGGNLTIFVNDKADNRSVTKIADVSVAGQMRSFADGVPVQLEMTTQRRTLSVFLGNRLIGKFIFKRMIPLFGIGIGRIGSPTSIDTLAKQNIRGFVGQLYFFPFRIMTRNRSSSLLSSVNLTEREV